MSLIHSEYPAFRIPEPATKIVTSSASSIISAISPVTNTISPVTAVSFTLNSTVEHYSKHLVSSTVPPVTEPNKINNNNPIVIIILLSIITLFSTISFVSLLYCCYQFKFLWRPLSKRKNIKLIAPLGTDQTKQANNLENKTSEGKKILNLFRLKFNMI